MELDPETAMKEAGFTEVQTRFIEWVFEGWKDALMESDDYLGVLVPFLGCGKDFIPLVDFLPVERLARMRAVWSYIAEDLDGELKAGAHLKGE